MPLEIERKFLVRSDAWRAGIEPSSEDEPFDLPEWLGKEVTGDPQYLNSNLARS